jgi:hypothetical protein
MNSPDNEFIFQEIVTVKSFSAFPKIPLHPNFSLASSAVQAGGKQRAAFPDRPLC